MTRDLDLPPGISLDAILPMHRRDPAQVIPLIVDGGIAGTCVLRYEERLARGDYGGDMVADVRFVRAIDAIYLTAKRARYRCALTPDGSGIEAVVVEIPGTLPPSLARIARLERSLYGSRDDD